MLNVVVYEWCVIRPICVILLIFTHSYWDRVTYMCVGKLAIIGLGNGLSPVRSQSIIRTSVGILLVRLLRTTFTKILIRMKKIFKKMHLKMSLRKWRPFCIGFILLMSVKWPQNLRVNKLHEIFINPCIKKHNRKVYVITWINQI